MWTQAPISNICMYIIIKLYIYLSITVSLLKFMTCSKFGGNLMKGKLMQHRGGCGWRHLDCQDVSMCLAVHNGTVMARGWCRETSHRERKRYYYIPKIMFRIYTFPFIYVFILMTSQKKSCIKDNSYYFEVLFLPGSESRTFTTCLVGARGWEPQRMSCTGNRVEIRFWSILCFYINSTWMDQLPSLKLA